MTRTNVSRSEENKANVTMVEEDGKGKTMTTTVGKKTMQQQEEERKKKTRLERQAEKKHVRKG